MNKYKSFLSSLKTILICTLVAFGYSCATKTSNLNKNIDVEITKQTIENCTYFCHYIDFKITNNNDVGIYMPTFSFGYFDLINKKGDTITDIIRDYEDMNFYDNSGESEYALFMDKITNENTYYDLIRSEAYKKNMLQLIKKDYENVVKHLNFDQQNIPKNVEMRVKEELILMKYGYILFIPPKSSITISQGINYLFYNYLFTEDFLPPYDHFDLTHDAIKSKYKEYYEEYKHTKSTEVKIVLNYRAQPPFREDEIVFPLSYFGDDIPGSVEIPVKYPKKILDKYYLVDKLKDKDSLIIKFENGF